MPKNKAPRTLFTTKIMLINKPIPALIPSFIEAGIALITA